MDPVQVRRAYKFRTYPTQPQQRRSVRLLADHCDLYNAALEERPEAWRKRKAGISYITQSAQPREIRAGERDGQDRLSFTAQQPALRRLDVVFGVFYDRCRAGQQPGYPRFEPHSRFGQVMFCARMYGRRPARSRARRAVARRGREPAEQAAS